MSETDAQTIPGLAVPVQQTATEDQLEACLIFLCRHFDMPVSESVIRASLTGLNSAMTAEQFVRIAGRVGLATTVGRQELSEIDNAILPLVAMMRDGRAIVLVERIGPGRIAAYHSDYGPEAVVLSEAEIAEDYAGYVVVVRPYRHSLPEASSSAAAGMSGHWFWGPITDNWWSYVQVGVAAALTNFLGLSVSVFVMVVYDRILPNEAIDSLIALTIGVSLAIGFDFLIRTLRSIFVDTAGMRADLAIGRSIFDYLLNMQMKSRRGSAGAFANALREFETLRDFFTSATLVAVVDLPFILLFLFVIAMIGGPLALVPGVAVPAILVLGIVLQPLLARFASQAFEEGQTKQGVLVETISALETIKTTGAGPLMRQRWEASINAQSGIGARNRRVTQLAINATTFAQQATQVGIVFFGVFLISAGELSMGALIASVMLSGRALAPLGQLAQTMTRINQARTSYRNLDAMMKEPTERQADRRYVSRTRLSGKIEFRDVSFRYPGQSVNALKGVSFTIQPGEKVALVGRIGSGKSTAMRLLLGLYDPDEGGIFVDDTDLRQIDPADLRGNIGAVLQDIWLFSGTIRQNIAVGARRPRDEDILNAAIASGVHDFVSQSAQGYDMMLAERGEGLSGGQRQSIALARAIIANTPILVMDEPTSMMDMQTEQTVINRLKSVTREKTLVVITHRTSVLELVDRVIVIDGGRIVADGPKSILNRAASQRARVAEVRNQVPEAV